MGKFYSYSFGNILEIARQMPSASRVAGMYASNQCHTTLCRPQNLELRRRPSLDLMKADLLGALEREMQHVVIDISNERGKSTANSEPGLLPIPQIQIAELASKNLSLSSNPNDLYWDDDEKGDQVPRFIQKQYQSRQCQPSKEVDWVLDTGIQTVRN
jgi:hypothetical protein